MGLTQKILLLTSLLVVALLVTTLALTTFQADRLAHETVHQALAETRGVWQTFEADRYDKLRMGVRVLANDPYFKAALETGDVPTVVDTLKERGSQDLKADFFIATGPDGIVVGRSDRPGGSGEDLSRDPVVMRPLESGEESATVWRQGNRLFHAVSVPMVTGPDLKGVLIAGYGINEALAGDIRKITRSEIAYLTHAPGQPPQLSVSSLGPREPALAAVLGRPELAANANQVDPFEVDLAGERHVAVSVPLKAATGDVVGRVVALRSLGVEMAAFRQFRNSLVIISVVVMVLALAVAYFTAARITGPVRRLVGVVERARDGKFTGKVAADGNDEIAVLARTFNKLLADLREKEQMIDFLREGMTLLKKGSGADAEYGTAVTASLKPLRSGDQTIGEGTVFADRYEILENIGKGGMGVVFRARDRRLDEEVALKVLRSEALEEDPALVGRFKQELKLARRITHRNVLRTHDFEEWHGLPYISMEYVEGVTLKDLIRSKGALPLGVGLRIAKQVCQGLEAAHAGGVVHRDVKPQNMLILPETGDVKIMDFGIARVSELERGESDPALTMAGTVMGTPDYMSPEQASGTPADFRSDIYSLGVVLFEMFTGRLPFTGEKVMSVILGHIQKPPPLPRKLNPQVPPELEQVILRCLDKNPKRRYQQIGDVLDALSNVSAGAEAA
ncbi:MAG TPA: protein kinase [Vicinamibacteria bacterium]|nr:protein kinase [Vicinamibacteria bacterium]